MPAFFDLLREEPHAAVRLVLGHFIFVYIHPYMDGNGRVGRIPVDGHSGNRPQRLRQTLSKKRVSARILRPSRTSSPGW